MAWLEHMVSPEVQKQVAMTWGRPPALLSMYDDADVQNYLQAAAARDSDDDDSDHDDYDNAENRKRNCDSDDDYDHCNGNNDEDARDNDRVATAKSDDTNGMIMIPITRPAPSALSDATSIPMLSPTARRIGPTVSAAK
mgnify:CR=1 FL=1